MLLRSMIMIFNAAQRLLAECFKCRRSSSSDFNYGELDKYLTTYFEFSDVNASEFDILSSWHLKKNGFSVISAIAGNLVACIVFML